MTFLEVAEKTIQSAIKECDSHLDRIRKVRRTLELVFPLQEDRLEKADDALVEHIDPLIYRFTKLQNSMGINYLCPIQADDSDISEDGTI